MVVDWSMNGDARGTSWFLILGFLTAEMLEPLIVCTPWMISRMDGEREAGTAQQIAEALGTTPTPQVGRRPEIEPSLP